MKKKKIYKHLYLGYSNLMKRKINKIHNKVLFINEVLYLNEKRILI